MTHEKYEFVTESHENLLNLENNIKQRYEDGWRLIQFHTDSYGIHYALMERKFIPELMRGW